MDMLSRKTKAAFAGTPILGHYDNAVSDGDTARLGRFNDFSRRLVAKRISNISVTISVCTSVHMGAALNRNLHEIAFDLQDSGRYDDPAHPLSP